MKTETMLHILRNPFGHSDNRKKQARLKAADEIERWEKYGFVRKKPPLGLMPRHVHDQNRAFNITAAIMRYGEARKHVPSEWFDELTELSIIKEGKL